MKFKKMYKGKIPFDSNGNLMSYDYYTTTWKDNYVFDAYMQIIEYNKGQSSATYIFKDQDGHTYSMFARSFMEFINTHTIANGMVMEKHHYTFCKKGDNYSLIALD